MLRLVVRNFIETAWPVGSRFLAKNSAIGLSPASIRNTMSDLETLGFLGHPHTSAGRIPTELGYRKFVDELMETSALAPGEKAMLRSELERLMGDTENLLRDGSRLLARLSNLLGIVLSPRLSTGTLERFEIVPLSSTRAMFVLSVRGGMVRTIVFEVESELSRDRLDRVVALLNERLAGLTLEEIQRTLGPRLRDLDDEPSGIIRLVLSEGPTLFNDSAEARRLRHGGTQNLLTQPEFQEAADLQPLIDLIEDENYVINLLDEREGEGPLGRAVISIGSEHSVERLGKYSIVTARYQIGDTAGTIGVVGPIRMDYTRVVPLVEGMAALLCRDSDIPQAEDPT